MTDYKSYREAAIRHGVPPLTYREWLREGRLTFKQSKARTEQYQERRERREQTRMDAEVGNRL